MFRRSQSLEVVVILVYKIPTRCNFFCLLPTGNTPKPSKSIEPWNVIHNSYTGFILSRT